MVLLANFTLMITAIRPDQFGEYVCVASNMAATVSASARIQTEGKTFKLSNLLTLKAPTKQMPKFTFAKFEKLFCRSYIVLRIQRQEGKL